MKILIFIAALLMLFSVESGYCAEPLPQITNSVQQAYEELLTVKYFAFGGVGYGGSTSPGERAFRAVLASTNALELFTGTLTKGTDAGKLYALCGIRTLNKISFDDSAMLLKKADPTVPTMSGCFASSERASSLIQQIANGTYDTHLK